MPDLHTPGQWIRFIARNAKRLMILILGTAVLLAGVAMLALPGPGVLVIILGLVILATEFAWAERMLDRTTATAAGAAVRVTDNNTGRAALAASGFAMIVGGIVVAIMFPSLRIVGISVALAGVIGLVTLLPQVRGWIDEKAANGSTEPSPG
ncbi:MAG TPA: PGPGW domain-containing protein [Ilumatobacteraceae bacterium]|nr:PGPGW domain-containing protein [Ilumatobacteraceae bacterium]